MSDLIHERHKPITELEQPRPLLLACSPLRSNVNLSRIVRAAGCCGVRRMIVCGKPKLDPKIARDALQQVQLELHRSLPPVLARLKRDEQYTLIGLEQTSRSENLHTFLFPQKTVLVLGNERKGLEDNVLSLLDHAVEIPVYGLPYSYNVATATAMALYEYCRQYPSG